MISIAPWSIRNWSAFDQLVPISINESTVAAGANCDPAYNGPDTGFWRLDCLARASAAATRPSRRTSGASRASTMPATTSETSRV